MCDLLPCAKSLKREIKAELPLAISRNIVSNPGEIRVTVIVPFPKQFSPATLAMESCLSVALLWNENFKDSS